MQGVWTVFVAVNVKVAVGTDGAAGLSFLLQDWVKAPIASRTANIKTFLKDFIQTRSGKRCP
jgi:hypothetical protein